MSKREIKFRSWCGEKMYYNGDFANCPYCGSGSGYNSDYDLMQYTGLKDKNGVEIYEGDILQFSDKWEWNRIHYGHRLLFSQSQTERDAIMAELEAEPYERRVIEIPRDYEWLLSSDTQSWWEVIGNIHQNPEILQ